MYTGFSQLPQNPPDDVVNNYRKRDDGDPAWPRIRTTWGPVGAAFDRQFRPVADGADRGDRAVA
jgi:hypothetical protein